MSYNITLTNGNLLAVLPDGTINTSISPPLTLIGRNYAGGYGEFQNDNYVRLLESGANSNAPAAPLVGQLWYNTNSKTLQVYNGTNFKPISGATASATAPTINSTGDLWYDTVNQQLNVWTGTEWLLVGPPSSTGTGAIPAILLDNANVQHSVVELTVDGNIVGIVSQSARFAPYPTLSGFANVYPGITLSTSVNSRTPSFVGTVTNSILLNGLASNAFMRTDQDTQTKGTLTVLNGNGLFVGNNSEFTANVVGNSTVNLYNTANDGNFNIGINQGGTRVDAIHIDGVTGNTTIAGNLTVAGTTTTINTEIINTNEVITGNLIVGNVSANNIVSNTVTANYFIGNGSNISNITGANVVGAVSLAGNATVLRTAAWTVQQVGNTIAFQVLGNTVASLTPSGNLVATSVTATTINAATIGNSGATLVGTLNSASAAQPNITSLGTLNSLAISTPLPYSSGGTGLASPGTGGNVLTSTGSGWTSSAPATVKGLGLGGEVWHDVTGSRSQGVTYYNTYGYPIQVSGNFGCNGGGQGYIYIDGVLISFWQAQFNGCGGFSVNMPCIVPPGSSYMLANMGGSARGWYELY